MIPRPGSIRATDRSGPEYRGYFVGFLIWAISGVNVDLV